MTPDLSYYWEGGREWCEDDDEWDMEEKYTPECICTKAPHAWEPAYTCSC